MFDPISVKPLKTKRTNSYSLIAHTLVLSVLAVFPSISYPDDIQDAVYNASSCGLASSAFFCPTIEDAFTGCSTLSSFYPGYSCSFYPFNKKVVVFHDRKYRTGEDLSGDFSTWFVSVKGCPIDRAVDESTGKCPPAPTVIIDPGHGLIEQKDGTFAYQREPSPVYKLVEDELTLQMAFKLKSLLEADGIKVFMLRESGFAPHAPVGCSALCKDDLKE